MKNTKENYEISNHSDRMFLTTGNHLHSNETCRMDRRVNAEQDYVRREPLRKRGPFVENPYADVDEEEEEYGDRTDYR